MLVSDVPGDGVEDINPAGVVIQRCAPPVPGAVVDGCLAAVNAAFAVAEAGMWAGNRPRISRRELQTVAEIGELVVARSGERVVGCVQVQRIDDATMLFGMLSVVPAAQGAGVGRALVDFVESMAASGGAQTMRLELLVPTDRERQSKQLLVEWYSAMGYVQVGLGSLADEHANAVASLLVPCEFQLWEKALVGLEQ